MATKTSKYFPCRACGVEVAWAETQNGKKYLAQPLDWHGSEGNATRTYLPAHECTPDEGWRERAETQRLAEVAQATAEGRIIKGVKIRVIKGRKVAKGTTGIAFWVADEPNGYGVVNVGFNTEDGGKFYVNIANLEVAN
jgi:hypothetical protein